MKDILFGKVFFVEMKALAKMKNSIFFLFVYKSSLLLLSSLFIDLFEA